MQVGELIIGKSYKGADMMEVLENMEIALEVIERNNPYCVISKVANENGWHDIQSNSAWGANPYGEEYAVVPDDMTEAIMETYGFCNLELNEDGTEVVAFTATEIPIVPEEEPEPTQEERIVVLEETVADQEEQLNEMTEYQAEMLYELSLMQLGIEE